MKKEKRFSAFQIVSVILIIILVVAIIIQIGIIINYKHTIDNLKDKNEEISQSIIIED